jgi:hypothetical protein
MLLPLSALSVYNEKHGSKPPIGSNKINGQDLEFQWSFDPVSKIAEAFKAYEPAPDSQDIQSVLCPEDVVEDQPVWDLNAKSDRKNDHGGEEGGKFSDSSDRKEPDFVWRQRDPIAWYCPASFHPPEKYGIHFDAAKVRRLALKLERYAGSAALSEDEWLVASIVKVFWHEICHGWVEDLCHLIESLNGENHYVKTHGKYKSYIFMEEALCNTVSLGMVKFFFQSHQQKELIFDSVIQFMKNQPKGYKDFRRDMPQWAGQSDWISENMRKLLVDVYGFRSTAAVQHAVNTFLEPPREWDAHHSMRRDSLRYSRFPRFTEVYMNARNYPVYLH